MLLEFARSRESKRLLEKRLFGSVYFRSNSYRPVSITLMVLRSVYRKIVLRIKVLENIKDKIGYAGKIHKSVRMIPGNWYRLRNSIPRKVRDISIFFLFQGKS
jgi:hypothetical protein